MRTALRARLRGSARRSLLARPGLGAALLAVGVLACSEPEEPVEETATGAPPAGAPSAGEGGGAATQEIPADDLRRSPGFASFAAAQQAVEQGNLVEAQRLLQLACRQDPTRWEFHDGHYKVRIRMGDSSGAITALQTAIEHHPAREDFWYNLGILEMRGGAFEKAEQCFARATQLAPDLVLGHFNRGLNHYQQGRLIVSGPTVDHERMKLALQSFDRALAADPTFTDAHYWSGMAHLAMHDDEAALASFEAAIDGGADRIGPYLEAARVHLQNDDVEEAERLFTEAASVDVEWAQPHVGLGRIDERRGDYLAALRHFETAQAIDPTVASTYRGLANCYRRLDQEERAEEAQARFEELSAAEREAENERIAQVTDRRAESFYDLGVALQDEGRMDEAMIAYQKALGSDPEHSPTLTQLGTIYMKRGDMELALGHLRRAYASDGTNLRAYRLIAEIEELIGNLPIVEEPPGDGSSEG